jgi:hypothetical protein
MEAILDDDSLFWALHTLLLCLFLFEVFYQPALKLIGSVQRIPSVAVREIGVAVDWLEKAARILVASFPPPQGTEPVPEEDTASTTVQVEGVQLGITAHRATIRTVRSAESQSIVTGYFAVMLALFAAVNDFSGDKFQTIVLLFDLIVLAYLCYATRFGDRLLQLDKILRVRGN